MSKNSVTPHRSSAPSLADALRWTVRSKPSGMLKLSGGDRVHKILVINGTLYVSEQHPSSHRLQRCVAPPGQLTSRPPDEYRQEIQHFAEGLSRERFVTTFRFCQVESTQGWIGPLSAAQLLMEVATLDRDEAQLLEQIGGEQACFVASQRPTTGLLLTLDDELVLSRLGTPASGLQVCEELGGDQRRWLTSMVRLAAADLLDPAVAKGPDPSSPTQSPSTVTAPHPAALAIWREQFHLTGDPFSLTPDPSFLFLSDGHAEALAGLKLGIWERRGLMVMIGEVGTGKTTLIYSLLAHLDPEIETAYLSNTLLSFEEILYGALLDFGIECKSQRRLDLIETLNAFLRRSAEAGKTVVLVIDEAQNLSDEVFEGLRLLLNFETYKSKLLQIILVGQPELATRLRGRGLRQVRDRIAVRCHLNPLTRREAKDYIDHRLELVGGSSHLFTGPALGVLVRRSKGIPRRINILCHNAMLFAYGRDLTRINWSTARQAFKDMDGSSLRRD